MAVSSYIYLDILVIELHTLMWLSHICPRYPVEFQTKAGSIHLNFTTIQHRCMRLSIRYIAFNCSIHRFLSFTLFMSKLADIHEYLAHCPFVRDCD